ncbi:hypothetical protein LTR62_002965 [Meristemomyces frigidus]|uniref:X-Pro dipeptidyl-peptidase n=1 Tax=Meristemomyces frigidus TaxID=1508187 RepID=A0AAN7TPT5_9PEZI|nr:hypothetical protein LTR62_002965 [Meristemomyces frigidus]
MVANSPRQSGRGLGEPQDVASSRQTAAQLSERVKQLARDITADLKDLDDFYNISFSKTRLQRLGEYLAERNNELVVAFVGLYEHMDAESRVDWLLLRGQIQRGQEKLRVEWAQLEGLSPLLAWTGPLVALCELRQRVAKFEPQDAGKVLSDAMKEATALTSIIAGGGLHDTVSRFTAYRAAFAIEELYERLQEWYGFYAGYDPLFTWWVEAPWQRFSIQALVATIREKIVGIAKDELDTIVGQPCGRESMLADLKTEVIAYTPEEIIEIGEKEYAWCEREMMKASKDLGYGADWKQALEHVKNMYVDPSQQPYMIHELAEEAVEYITKRDMVTVPEICNQTWRTFMMTPEQQKINPFFLGGPYIQVSYPTSAMSHEDKLMIMRGNSRPFSRSTVFHELIPGHHLQWYYMDRYNQHRGMFQTPFWIEGWSFYWEMILWDRGFPDTPENRIGMLFWRMHRCARIIFSLNFHLGKMTPSECIDYLVDKVGHERATAEGEVRRSFNGDYSPLYQAGYMLGALQFYSLRKEIVGQGKMTEKLFHDRILRGNNMPVEMVRAMLKGEMFASDHAPCWRWYKGSHG